MYIHFFTLHVLFSSQTYFPSYIWVRWLALCTTSKMKNVSMLCTKRNLVNRYQVINLRVDWWKCFKLLRYSMLRKRLIKTLLMSSMCNLRKKFLWDSLSTTLLLISSKLSWHVVGADSKIDNSIKSRVEHVVNPSSLKLASTRWVKKWMWSIFFNGWGN